MRSRLMPSRSHRTDSLLRPKKAVRLKIVRPLVSAQRRAFAL